VVLIWASLLWFRLWWASPINFRGRWVSLVERLASRRGRRMKVWGWGGESETEDRKGEE
jgi:hypothetical protein